MNRAERRRAEKNAESDPVITMKRSDIERIKREAVEEATDSAMLLLLSIPIKVMRDKFDWGTKTRLPKLAEALIDEYQAFSEGEATLQEYQDMVYECCGVKFERTKEG